MNEEMHMAIRDLNRCGLNVVSTNRQIKNGTIMVQDMFNEVLYTIHASGYARKRVPCHPFAGPFAHYQLNKTRRIRFQWLGGESYNVERILLPGEYLALSKMVINAVARERKVNLKKKINFRVNYENK